MTGDSLSAEPPLIELSSEYTFSSMGDNLPIA